MSKHVNINDSILPIEELHLTYITHKIRNDYGYLESSKTEVPVNGNGEIIPLYTYPCYEYLNSFDWTGCKVFEFGSGYSTVWWNRLGAEVHGVDMSQDWADKYDKVMYEPDKEKYPQSIYKCNTKFDVITLDCSHVRYQCVVPALECLNDGGVIVLDNSEQWTNTKELLDTDDTLIPVHFHGFKALHVESETTSCYLHRDFSKKAKTILPMAGTERKPPDSA